jgi:hypothetical protein
MKSEEMSIRHTILTEMDQIISDPTLRGIDKFRRLLRLCEAYWRDIFPELGTEAHAALTADEKEARWVPVRAADRPLLNRLTNSSKIREILNLPLTGRPVAWLLDSSS